jgi:AraC family L-rhamnose operon regulatory protein RhaS
MNHPARLGDHPDTPWYYNERDKLMVQQFMFNNYSIGMHAHNYHEINIVMGGRGFHYYGEHVFEVSEGDVFVVPPKIKHGYWSAGDLAVYHVIICAEFFQKYEADLINLPGYFALFDIAPQMREYAGVSRFLKFRDYEYDEIFQILESSARLGMKEHPTIHDYIGMNVNALYFITRLTACFHRECQNEGSSSEESDSVLFTRAVERIYQAYDTKLDINQLAKELHISRSTYYMLFRKYSGKTPGEFINQIRIAKARTLLHATDASITSVALQTGFFDASHFIHAFEKAVGISPREYREKGM